MRAGIFPGASSSPSCEANFHFAGCSIQNTEDFGEQLNAGNDQRRFSYQLAARAACAYGYRHFRGDVARCDVFGEERPQQIVVSRRVE